MREDVTEERLRFDDGAVIFRTEGPVAHIILDRPEKLNAVSVGLLDSLREALVKLDSDDRLWVGILSGRGRAFCSGADVRQRVFGDERAVANPQGAGMATGSLMFNLQNWKPIIAAVHGYAVGAGLSLLLQADISVVTEDAKLQIAEVALGLGAAQFWTRLNTLGAGAFAADVALTGRVFSGREAANAGVVNLAVPAGDHVEAAREFAEKILQNPPLAARSTVRARRHQLQRADLESGLLHEVFKLHLTEDFQETGRAFAEGRPRKPFAGR